MSVVLLLWLVPHDFVAYFAFACCSQILKKEYMTSCEESHIDDVVVAAAAADSILVAVVADTADLVDLTVTPFH